MRGKFLFVGDEKLYVRGVTYGGFRPDARGNDFHHLELIERDFAQMRANGLNAVRVYTPPPRALLDVAGRHGLRVMVGLTAEQYVRHLVDRRNAPDVEERVRERVRTLAGHPALLCYAIANEIPAPLVRWLGARRVEDYLERLCRAIKAEDPEGLVTYVNYPTTEYLQLPFLDLVSFNVYLESKKRFEAYLARLQNLAGDRPLLMSEVGLDSRRHGKENQALTLDWQLRSSAAAGCTGAFVYAWTDEWFRGGQDVLDWDFGLTTRARLPKPALAAVRRAFDEVPFPRLGPCPRISVVVCSYNGARTLRDCMEGLRRLDYPDHEVIVVDDGSTDATPDIAREYGVRLVRTENRGLSSARNTGLEVARGDIVAYIDDDAWPDPHWLTYLAHTFETTTHAGVGGPNIPPPGDGPIADCVANSPGGPVHVLLSDREAEHIPGCNMAFRKSCLQAIGGFDPTFRVAGDDVDLCWRLQERGWTLGFHAGAMVWHHRRNSVRAYWRQQVGYGKAEALLERKWPQKYNGPGHATWSGRVYGHGAQALLGSPGRIYHGTWGSAPFQSLYQPAPSVLFSLPRMPEWYLVLLALAVLAGLGSLWRPLLWSLAFLGVGFIVSLIEAVLGARRASFKSLPPTGEGRLAQVVLTSLLHLMQPAARLWGRLRHGLVPWRRRGMDDAALPWPRTFSRWCEEYAEPEVRLQSLEESLRRGSACFVRGGDWDRWDLEVRGGMFGAVRFRMAAEDYAGGKQLLRLRTWPLLDGTACLLAALMGSLSALAVVDEAWAAAAALGSLGLTLGAWTLLDCARAEGSLVRAIERWERGGQG